MNEHEYFQSEVETMPRPQLEALQEARLMELVPYAYERSPLVRSIWSSAGVHPRDIRSVDDFRERAPFIDKDDIRAFRDRHGDPYGGLVCVDPATLTDVGSTSGTTGDATFAPERWDEWSPFALDVARAWWSVGIRPGDKGFGLWNFRTASYYEGLQLCGAIPVFFDPFTMDWDRILDRAEDHEVALFWLGAADVIPFTRLAEQHDLRHRLRSVKVLKYAGAPLSARVHERMSKEWGLEVCVGTSAGDAGMSFECSAHDGCHIWEDKILVEHLDPDGNEPVVDGGVGELVVTSLENPVAPLLRFRSDDLVRVTRERCSCGRTHARQWPLGRKGDEMVVGGKTVLPLDIWPAIEVFPATEAGVYQVIRPQREVDQLRVRVGYRPDMVTSQAAQSSLYGQVHDAIERRVGVTPVVELMPETQLLGRGHKVVRVVKE